MKDDVRDVSVSLVFGGGGREVSVHLRVVKRVSGDGDGEWGRTGGRGESICSVKGGEAEGATRCQERAVDGGD